MTRVAFIASGEFELAPLRARGVAAGQLYARGPGFQLARAAAEQAIAAARPDALVSIGVCGALAADLQLGDIIVDEASPVPSQAPPHRRGRVVSQDRVAVTPADKAQLAGQGIAVEMESAAVRGVAAEHGLKFFCVKAVSDTAAEGFPLDFNAYRGGDGNFQLGRIGAAALVRPWVIPGLIRLRQRAQHAAQKLGEFLVHCEF